MIGFPVTDRPQVMQGVLSEHHVPGIGVALLLVCGAALLYMVCFYVTRKTIRETPPHEADGAMHRWATCHPFVAAGVLSVVLALALSVAWLRRTT